MKYVSLSGGADSVAVALLLWERGEDFELLFSDTGAEFEETIFTVTKTADYIGKKLNVVSGGTFYQWLVHFGYLIPAPMCRWCTRLLKQQPMDKYIEKDDVNFWGIRADEPRRQTPRKKKYQVELPLVEAGYGKKEVKQLCKKHGLLNPIYITGGGRTNTSCFCCFFQRKADWKWLLKNKPLYFQLAEQWENMSINEAIKKGENPWGIHQNYTLEQFRKADEKQLKLFPEIIEKPCLICQ